MARTDSDLVKGVLAGGRDYDVSPEDGSDLVDLTPYIAAASVIANRVATCATTKGVPLSEGELTVIETWLAAHAYAMSDLTYSSKTTDGQSASFAGQTTLRLEATRYGQMALLLDYSGCLDAINKRAFAGSVWLGKAPSDQIDAKDRGY